MQHNITENTKLHHRTVDLSGKRFGRLIVLSFNSYKGHYSSWNCLCDCGNTKVVKGTHLNTGGTKSCGCLFDESVTRFKPTHKMVNTPIHRTWNSMLQRCTNPKATSYADYGGRGITVCEEWTKDFMNFYNDMKDTHKPKLTLDRIDVNGNYEPSNCKWATRGEQQQNRRDTVQLTVHGCTATMEHWVKVSGTKYQTIYSRYYKGKPHHECVFGATKDNLN